MATEYIDIMPTNISNSSECNPSEPTDKNDECLRLTLGYLTMSVGIPQITHQNFREFYARVFVIESISGGSRYQVTADGLKQVVISIDDVKRWIGLKTRAATMTRKQFLGNLSTRVDDLIRKTYNGNGCNEP